MVRSRRALPPPEVESNTMSVVYDSNGVSLNNDVITGNIFF